MLDSDAASAQTTMLAFQVLSESLSARFDAHFFCTAFLFVIAGAQARITNL